MFFFRNLLTFIILLNYKDCCLIKNKIYIFFLNYLTFSFYFFIQLSVFYWKLIICIAKIFKEFCYVNFFVPFFVQYLFCLTYFFDLIWFYYLFFVTAVILFVSLPYYLYICFKNIPNDFNTNDYNKMRYKLSLIVLILVNSELKKFLIINLVIFVFEIIQLLQRFR